MYSLNGQVFLHFGFFLCAWIKKQVFRPIVVQKEHFGFQADCGAKEHFGFQADCGAKEYFGFQANCCAKEPAFELLWPLQCSCCRAKFRPASSLCQVIMIQKAVHS